ncbi:Cytochrome P450 94C1 [Camellia lanceoleosa]|uniref:Cytochrome P450 94C1 n=1 Tax=Camellia lanceoleosa TaxID=1840588 RepID=A0ACC0IBC7_9ERIC|nr:Cytochrome P450 94C1 [Camellia lanceoleosa]
MLSISDFNKAFDLASKLSAERAMAAWPLIWKLKRALNLGTEKKLKQAIKIVDLLAEEMIKNRRKMGFSTQKDLLSRFMGTIDDDQYLRDIVISFLLAGRDTVASGLTSFFWLLAQHPEVEKAIRDESDRVMGPVGQSEDDTLPDGTFVRKGTRVTYHPYAMGGSDGVGLEPRPP